MTSRAAGLRVLAFALAASAAGQGAEPPASADWTDFRFRRGTFSVVTENDKYFAGTDRHYTNGLKLTWLNETDLDESTAFTQRVAELMPWLDPAHHRWHYKVGFTLGQNIYTPGDTTPPPSSRTTAPTPAGFTAGSSSMRSSRTSCGWSRSRSASSARRRGASRRRTAGTT